MTIDDLWSQIVAAGKEHDFVLRDRAMPESQPSSATVVEPAADDSGRWVMYFSERGEIFDQAYYPDESAVCDAASQRLGEDLSAPPPSPLTAEEQEQADVQSAKMEQERRRMLSKLGIDPDHA